MCHLTLHKVFICSDRTRYDKLPLDSHCPGYICRGYEMTYRIPRDWETTVEYESHYCCLVRNSEHVIMSVHRQAVF